MTGTTAEIIALPPLAAVLAFAMVQPRVLPEAGEWEKLGEAGLLLRGRGGA